MGHAESMLIGCRLARAVYSLGHNRLACRTISPNVICKAASGMNFLPSVLDEQDAFYAGGQILWKKELPAGLQIISIQVDPRDCRHVCMCSDKGDLILMRFLNIGRDRYEV